MVGRQKVPDQRCQQVRATFYLDRQTEDRYPERALQGQGWLHERAESASHVKTFRLRQPAIDAIWIDRPAVERSIRKE